MGLEPGTSAYRVERSTAEPKINGDERKIPGGMIMFHPRKNRLPYKWKPINGDTEKIIRERNASRYFGNSLLGDPLFSRGTEQAVPGRAPFDASCSPSSEAAPLLLPVTPINRAAVWRSSGVVARPWGVGWRLGEPAPRGAY